LKQYYKAICERLRGIDGKIVISGPAINQSGLWNYVDKSKYKIVSQGYTGYSGCFQTFKRARYYSDTCVSI